MTEFIDLFISISISFVLHIFLLQTGQTDFMKIHRYNSIV